MEILRFFSMLYSLCFVLVIFLMLYDLRFDRRKNNLISALAMSPLILLTAVLFFVLGNEVMSKLIFVILSVPSLIFFLLMAKKRDGRFFFTFCVADTICFELIVLTTLLDHWLGGDRAILLFVSRLILFPVLSVIIWKYVRKPYKACQNSVPEGWGLFAVVSALYYGLLAYMVSFPTVITERPGDVPELLLVFIIMPLTYAGIFQTLNKQRGLYEAQEQHANADKQRLLLQLELAAEREHVEHARQHRHDMRHVIAVARDYIQKENFVGADKYLAEFDRSITSHSLTNYCENHIMNALLHITARMCEESGVAYSIEAQSPAALPYNDTEISVLFGNLFENAYEAALKCEKPFLHITVQVKNENLLVEIRNSVAGKVAFRNGLPVTTKAEGGIGVKSAKKVLDKYGGMLRQQQEGNVFITQTAQRLG